MSNQIWYETCKNFVVLRDKEDGEVWVRNFEETMDHAMMVQASKIFCLKS